MASPPFHPSPSVDERRVSGIDDYEEFKGYLEPAKHALSVATEGLKFIDEAWQALRNDTSKTDKQKAMVIAPAAEKEPPLLLRTAWAPGRFVRRPMSPYRSPRSGSR